MGRQVNRLTARSVMTERRPGRHADGSGLYLDISASGSRKWVFLYRSPTHRVARDGKTAGRLREMGLGTPSNVSLAMARDRARILGS